MQDAFRSGQLAWIKAFNAKLDKFIETKYTHFYTSRDDPELKNAIMKCVERLLYNYYISLGYETPFSINTADALAALVLARKALLADNDADIGISSALLASGSRSGKGNLEKIRMLEIEILKANNFQVCQDLLLIPAGRDR